MENQNQNVSADNIYKLNGRVPLSKAIPFGLQHVLAMFVSNLAPVPVSYTHLYRWNGIV